MENQFLALAHICIFTNNIAESVRFYTENLHFQLVYETTVHIDLGETQYVIVKLNDLIIELLEPQEKEAVRIGVEGTVNHFAITVKNLNTVISDLRKKNIKFMTEPFEIDDLLGGIKGVFIEGPTGEKIELFEYTGNRPF